MSGLLSRYTTLINGAPELTEVRRLSLTTKLGWHGRTITDPSPNGQDDDGCSRVQLVQGSTNCGNVTEFKGEEHQKVEEDYRIPLHDVAPLEQGAGWLPD